MSFTYPTAFVAQYGRNVQILSQQKGSLLRSCVYEEPITGDRAYIDQVGAVEAQEVSSRHADTPLISTPHSRRRIAPTPAVYADLIDRADKARSLNEFSSPYAMAGAMALGRRFDRLIIKCAFATAYTGVDGTTTVAFPAGNVVAVNSWAYGVGSGNIGLTISKLIEAKIILDSADVDPDEEKYFACHSKQIGNLLATTEATNSDYASVKALVEGKIDTFMGFRFKRTNLVETDSNAYRRCIAWNKSGIGLGIAEEIFTSIDELPTKNFSTQVYLRQDAGASRLEEAKVVEVKCSEA